LSILANRRLKLARKKFPHATFRLVEAEEPKPQPQLQQPKQQQQLDSTQPRLRCNRFETMQEGSSLEKPQDVVSWIDEKLEKLQDVG
jgi:hypothetical protein